MTEAWLARVRHSLRTIIDHGVGGGEEGVDGRERGGRGREARDTHQLRVGTAGTNGREVLEQKGHTVVEGWN